MHIKKSEIADTAKLAIREVKLENEKINHLFRDKEAEIDALRIRLGEREIESNKLKQDITESTKIEQKVKLLENKYVIEICNLKRQHKRDMNQKEEEMRIL